VKLLASQGASASEIQNDISVFLGDVTGMHRAERGQKSAPSPLSYTLQFGKDMTESARLGLLDPVVGREDETERVIQILSRRTKNNPCLIGEPGVGKTAVVEGLSLRIASGGVPEVLAGKSVIMLDISAMVAGAKYRGEFEERMKKVMNEVAGRKNVILFIDELHTIVGAGAAEGAVDAANILKPALARGEIQLIGATTLAEYRKHVERDAALERRFQPVIIEEPTPESALGILHGLRERYEAHHGVKISDEALAAAVNLSVRYVTDRFLPDKALDLVDEAASRKRIIGAEMPENIRLLAERAKRFAAEKEKAIRAQNFALAGECREKCAAADAQYERELALWRKKTEKNMLTVSAADVAEVVTMWTKIPVSSLADDEKEMLLHLEERLSERVIGQEAAVGALCRAVRRGRLGLADPARPVGSFIFLGPTGVGKTELARELAAALFGSRESIIRLDMSEYMESHSVAKIIGSPPGYVGFDEGGGLPERIRRAPYSVVLFDEVEKAHPDIFNLFLQILDDGVLTDSRGVHASFKNAVIIMTSNLGASELAGARSTGFSAGAEKEEREKARARTHEALRAHFRPEFLGRIDEIIVFEYLSEESVRKIAKKMLAAIGERIEKLGIRITFEESALALVSERGFNKKSGAREARRESARLIEDSFAEEYLRGSFKSGETIVCYAENGEIRYRK
jgi:ATP-dependent Clp protease ATP-binding subunit ClpC